MRRSKEVRLMWGKRMARGRDKARLARALEMSVNMDGQVGQFLVLGFGQPIRLLEFRVRGSSMRVVDMDTNISERIAGGLVWRMARCASARGLLAKNSKGGQGTDRPTF